MVEITGAGPARSQNNSIQVSDVGCTSPAIWAIFHCFLKHVDRELNGKQSSQNLNWAPIWDASIASSGLTHLTTMIIILKKKKGSGP